MLNTHYPAMRKHLTEGIVPFWQARVQDDEFGGYHTNFGPRGESLGTPEKYLNTQCRLVWWFSRLCRTFPNETGHAVMAKKGVEFLLRHLWDERYGGFRWKVRRDGAALDDGKIVYGQSFAIYALAEYSLATGDPRGLDYACHTFDALQKFCADTAHGGYTENHKADWTPEAPGFSGGDRKGLDTHMHLMESLTTLVQASGEAVHKRKLLELITLITQRMLDPVSGCGLNQFDMAFRPLPAIAVKRTWNAERFGEQPANPVDTTSYGHNTELCWLLLHALEVIREDVTPYRPVVQRLLDHALTHGVDWRDGGIFRDGLRDGGPLVMEKEFWQHAEAMVGFLYGWTCFAEPRYREAFENIWGFVQQYFLIAEVGEWRTLLQRDGTPIDATIGNPWKVAYHTGRALIECCAVMAR